VGFGGEIGESRWWFRVPGRVFQRLFPGAAHPTRCVEADYLQRTRFESVAELEAAPAAVDRGRRHGDQRARFALGAQEPTFAWPPPNRCSRPFAATQPSRLNSSSWPPYLPFVKPVRSGSVGWTAQQAREKGGATARGPAHRRKILQLGSTTVRSCRDPGLPNQRKLAI
jgi:hypothetical protein